LERVEERYLRWLFGLDSKIPGYIIREEIKRNKLRERAGIRAWSFEKRLEKGLGSELARICWRELRERSRVEQDQRGKWKERSSSRGGNGMCVK